LSGFTPIEFLAEGSLTNSEASLLPRISSNIICGAYLMQPTDTEPTGGSGLEPTAGKGKPLLKDKVTVATIIAGLGVGALAYFTEVSYNFLPVPLFLLVINSLVIICSGIFGYRARKLSPNSWSQLKKDFSPEPGISRTDKISHPRLLYLSSILLGLAGGLAGYFLLKNRSRPMANRLLVLGIPATIVYASIIASLLLKTPLTVPLPP
jgi:hypothetical protein